MKTPPPRRQCLHAATALATAGCLGQPAWALDVAQGAVSDGVWPDASRQRHLPWRLRLPAGAGPWPLVLFSHGLGGSVEAGTVWGQAWAAAGLAVLHLQHSGSDTNTWRAGLRSLRAAASAEQLLARVQDVRFVLDELARRAQPGEAPWAGLDLGAVGMAGHSFGALTTQALAGQRYATTASGPFSDPRPRAFMAFSPSQSAGARLSLTDIFGGITRPFLGLTGSHDGDPFGSYSSGERRAEVFQGLPAGHKALLWLDGADHMSFGGQDLRGDAAGLGLLRRHGPAAQQQRMHHALVARITSDWWRAELLGDAAARARLTLPAGLGAEDRWQQG